MLDSPGKVYWLSDAPSFDLAPSPLPSNIDIAVIGSGITGLNAALELSRSGMSVAVLDAGQVGQGASTRNAGFVGRTLHRSFSGLLNRHGLDCALAHYRELQEAFASVRQVVEAERIDCELNTNGRLILARSKRHLDQLCAELELRRIHLDEEYERLDRNSLRREIRCSADIEGGVLLPELYSIHPGKYCAGLLARARSAGARLHPFTPVKSVTPRRHGPGFEVTTLRGPVRALHVLIATNGYTGPQFDWFRRRLVPFAGHMMVTTKLSPALLDETVPQDRTYTDTNFLITAIRRSPAENRLIICGRPGVSMTVERACAVLLKDLRKMLPDIGEVGISHGWSGNCCGTFDRLPKLGSQQAGLHYAMGYLFNGIPLGTHLGRKAAWRILGMKTGASVFADQRFGSLPLYRGKPWFLPAFVSAMALKDRVSNLSGSTRRKSG